MTGALLGADVRIAAPEALWPSEEVRAIADRLAATSGARLTVTDDADEAVRDADFLYTDVWVSMGEPEERLGRADQGAPALPGQRGPRRSRPATRGASSCTAFRRCTTARPRSGDRLFDKCGLDALEVTDDVFESAASIVFDQAENRLHTIKAVMVATLGD